MSGYDSPSRQLLENEINDYIQVGHTLNVELLLANIGDAKFYKDMSEDFLNHIRWLTGTVNGIVITDEDVRFLVSCRRHDIGYAIVSFSVVFGKDGKYRKIGDIICISDMTGKDTDRPLYARSQVKSALDAFLDRGVNLYYLKEPVIEPGTRLKEPFVLSVCRVFHFSRAFQPFLQYYRTERMHFKHILPLQKQNFFHQYVGD